MECGPEMTTIIDAEALPGLATYFQGLPGQTKTAARMAINQVADRFAVPQARKEIQRQVAFPEGYLDEDRLGVAKRATGDDLEAIVRGRDRATSLARFAPGAALGSKSAITVVVKPGSTSTLRAAWLVRLRSGAALTEDKFNIGLAVRLKPGQQFINKKDTSAAVQLSPNVYLLYGPSVGQVFRDVADQLGPTLAEEIGSEFLRQFNRLVGD